MCKPKPGRKSSLAHIPNVSSSGEQHQVRSRNGGSIPPEEKRSSRHNGPAQRKRNRGNKVASWSVPLTPLPPLNVCVALDCEMVGVGPYGTESALARVCIVNSKDEVIFDTFVRPTVPVTDYRTFVSGIQPKDLYSDKTMSLDECRAAVSAILRGKILVGHGLENDLWALGIVHPMSEVRDTSLYGPYMMVRNMCDGSMYSPRKLRDLAWEELGMQIQVGGSAHSPVEDARAALSLYKAARVEWEKSITEQTKVEAQAVHERRLERIRARSKKANEMYNHTNGNTQQKRKGKKKSVRDHTGRVGLRSRGVSSRASVSVPMAIKAQ